MTATAATAQLGTFSQALLLRAERQRLIASNMANADTPGYAAREINFSDAMREATSGSGLPPLALTHARHQALPGSGGLAAHVGYEVATQPSLDGNSVDMDRERSKFTDNAIRYESTLRFINSHVKTMLTAIQGQ